LRVSSFVRRIIFATFFPLFFSLYYPAIFAVRCFVIFCLLSMAFDRWKIKGLLTYYLLIFFAITPCKTQHKRQNKPCVMPLWIMLTSWRSALLYKQRSLYRVGEKSDTVYNYVNIMPHKLQKHLIFIPFEQLLLWIDCLQFKCAHLFQNIFVILSEPRQCFCTRIWWIKQRSSLVNPTIVTKLRLIRIETELYLHRQTKDDVS